MKKLSMVVIMAAIILGGVRLYEQSQRKAVYEGIPAVSCLDQTKPIAQDLSLTIRIFINGQRYPLDGAIGHDRGNCLRSIYTDDTSGKVYVRSNYSQPYTLGEFFNVWHYVFNSKELFDWRVEDGGSLRVLVNGSPVDTYENTLLTAGEDISIYYSGRGY